MTPEQQIRTSSDSFSAEKKPQPKQLKKPIIVNLELIDKFIEEAKADERAKTLKEFIDKFEHFIANVEHPHKCMFCGSQKKNYHLDCNCEFGKMMKEYRAELKKLEGKHEI